MTIKYTHDHEWVEVNEGGIATIGITDHAQEALGDVVFVELPTVGKKLAQKDVAAVVESVKAAADVYAPVSGEIVAVNEALQNDPALINRAPTKDGWIFKILLTHPAELDRLIDRLAYDEMVKNG